MMGLGLVRDLVMWRGVWRKTFCWLMDNKCGGEVIGGLGGMYVCFGLGVWLFG